MRPGLEDSKRETGGDLYSVARRSPVWQPAMVWRRARKGNWTNMKNVMTTARA